MDEAMQVALSACVQLYQTYFSGNIIVIPKERTEERP